MRRLECILLTCLLAGCGGGEVVSEGQAAKKSNPASEAHVKAAWQGTWKLVACTANGESQMADMQWIVKGDRYTIRLDRKSGTDPYPFKLDAQLKQIDVHHHDTPKGTYGGHLKGIYEIQGNSLKICYDLKGQHYPTSFEAGRGSGQVVYQFQRAQQD